jgi:hypothetical protein
MKYHTLFFSLITIATLNVPNVEAFQNGNESGQNISRNLFEYNLYDRNRDRLRGRGIYDEEEEAYPEEYNYQSENIRRQATDGGRRFHGNG